VVSPTHQEDRAITEAIRDKLKEVEQVGKEEKSYQVQRNLSFTDAEKQDHVNYQSGMMVQFHRKIKGFEKKKRYEIVGVSDEQKVMIQEQGEESILPLPLDRPQSFQVYQQEHIKVAQGDIVRITGNGKTMEGHSLNNGQGHRIGGFTDNGNIQLENGQTISRDYGNFTLGYYRTSYSSQGKDADDVFIAQSSMSFPASNEKQFYVSASRGIERCLIYTDDKEALKWAALQEANRMSAAEVADVSRDKSLWLAARQAMPGQHRDSEYPQHEFEVTKEQVHEKTKTSLGREFSVEAGRSGGHEPGL